MLRRPVLRPRLLPPLVLLVAVTGCGTSHARGGATPGATSGATPGATAAAASHGLPSVSGTFGSKPTLTFPSPTPPGTVERAVLRQGTGTPVAKGDLLFADYLGQTWQGKVFDNSYDRKAPSGFVIGTGQVIPGWDQVLVGVKAGSRVLMSLPPAAGYGTSGNAGAGIKGTDTLVFVVDVVASYGRTASGQKNAVVQRVSTPGITVTGAPGAVPTVKVATGTPAPKGRQFVVLAKGSGAPVGNGQVVVQYVATTFAGSTAGSTYADGAPKPVPVGGPSPSPFDRLKGVPLGSRVLIVLPAASGQPAVAVVVDLVAQPRPAARS